MTNWESDVRWAMSRREDYRSPFRHVRLLRLALIASGLMNLFLFAALWLCMTLRR